MCRRGDFKCCCPSKHCVRTAWFTPVLIISSIIFLSLFLAGYKERNKWNETAEETECFILNHQVRDFPGEWHEHQYEDKCCCYDECTASGCIEKCGTTTGRYQQGLITVSYLDGYNRTKLRSDYPINTTIPCYYQPTNPKDLKLRLDPVMDFFIASMFFATVVMFFSLLWIFLTIPWCCEHFKRKCRQDKIRKQDIKRHKQQQKQMQEAKDAGELVDVVMKEEKPKEDREEVSKTMESVVSEITEITVQ